MREVNGFSGSHVPQLAPIRARNEIDAGRFTPVNGASDLEVTNFLNKLFAHAVVTGISDIHFEFDEIDGLRVRVRTSGFLSKYPESLTADQARIARAKICAKAKLDEQQRYREQDGRMMLYFGGRRVDMRLNLTPTVAGSKLVSRLLDSNNSKTNIDEMDVSHTVRSAMKRVVTSPEGMLLMAGPTGSGKTTTLYSLMHYLHDDIRHILTIEDPVEYSVKGFTQIEVNGHMGWLSAIAASLRQDPDVIMIGEIREDKHNSNGSSQSADAAFRAGETGHFVLSTVHANNAVTTISRLLQLGVPAAAISRTLKAVVAQRLIETLIPGSELEWIEPTAVEEEWLKRFNAWSPGIKLPKIINGGFSGRLPVVEMIEITAGMKELLNETNPTNIEARLSELAARQPQFETLAQAGVRLVLSGKTTLAQIMGITGDITWVPRFKRFEQILVQQAIINGDQVDDAYGAIDEAFQQGVVMRLDRYLLDNGVCTADQIDEAMRMSHASGI